MGITKTDFMRGMQCPKMLWLDKHHPELRVIPPDVQEALDEGNAFGDRAMGIFGDYIETTTYKPDGRLDYAAMLKKTQECIENGVNVVCEAALTYYGNYCAVDILRKNGDGWDIYEVKNCPKVEEQFVKDTAFQRYIAYKTGLKIKKCFIIYHGPDEANPFVIEEITPRVRNYNKYVDENIWRLGKIKVQNDEVIEPIGDHCECPYRCWYWDVCHI